MVQKIRIFAERQIIAVTARAWSADTTSDRKSGGHGTILLRLQTLTTPTGASRKQDFWGVLDSSYQFLSNRISSSADRLAWRRMLESVPLANSLCNGTMTILPSRSRSFTWLPFCPTERKLALWSASTTSCPDTTGSAGLTQEAKLL